MEKIFSHSLIILFFCFQFFVSKNTFATNAAFAISSDSIIKKNVADTVKHELWLLKGIWQDEKKLWTAPFKIKKNDFLILIPVSMAAFLSVKHDEEIYRAFKNYQHRNPWVSKVSPIITMGGDGNVDIAISAVYCIGGYVFKNEKLLQTGWLSAQALLHAAIMVRLSKMVFARQRPSAKDGIDHWHQFPQAFFGYKNEPQSHFDAFPSGHTISAMALATVIAEQYKETVYIPIIAYTLFAGVGLSRITEDTHWLSDVIVGAAMGYGIGKYMVMNRANTRWMLLPTSSKKNIGLTGIYKF